MIDTNGKTDGIKLVTMQSQVAGYNSAVPKSLGFIRYKIINGRIYYYWVIHTTRRGIARQKTLAYLGGTLPKGLKIGPVTPKMEKILKKRQWGKVKGKNI